MEFEEEKICVWPIELLNPDSMSIPTEEEHIMTEKSSYISEFKVFSDEHHQPKNSKKIDKKVNNSRTLMKSTPKNACNDVRNSKRRLQRQLMHSRPNILKQSTSRPSKSPTISRTFFCVLCSFETTRQANLKRHIIDIHA